MLVVLDPYFASIISLFDLNILTLRPSSSCLNPMRSAFFVDGLNTATFEICKGASRSIMPPCWPIWGFGRWCFLDMLRPSTRRRSSAYTSMTAPRRPLSRPAITMTVSPLRIFFMLKNFRRQRDDFHELDIAQLARHRPEYSGADRLELVRQQYRRIGVEADQRAVRAPHATLGAHDDRVVYLAFLDLAAWDRILDADLDDIADCGIAPLGAAQHLDAHQALGPAVVGYIEYGSHLNHGDLLN